MLFVNHHGPLPISSGGVCGGAAVAYNILHVVAANAQPGDLVIVAGDFNAQEGSNTIQHLESRLRRAAGGGIDYIFSNLGAGAAISASNLGNGGSDHDAISAVLRVEGSAPAAPADPEIAA